MPIASRHNFDQILAANKSKIYRICVVYAVAPLEPEDLFQEVTYQIWKSLPSFDERSNVNTWVYRIALNVCMGFQQRSSKNENPIRLESIHFEAPSITPETEQEERYEALYKCIQKLEEVDRSIIIMTLEELSYKEIAWITGLTANHVAVKMKRARKALLRCITTKNDFYE
ncbi:MAG: sigma-70 family RNA polymerase sigma factor [Cyclobacteriaceae bacterium]